MLKQLDVLIGLSVVFTIASLLVTMLTQFISSLLALRGKTFVRGLEVAFRALAPKQPYADVKVLAESVASHRLLSDSTLHDDSFWLFRWLRKMLWGATQQYASAATGEEVRRVLELLVKQEKIKETPVAVLEGAAGGVSGASLRAATEVKESAVREMNSLPVDAPVKLDGPLAQKATGIAATAGQVLAALRGSGTAEEISETVNESPAGADAGEGETVKERVDSFETVFNAAMDRAQQRFAYYGRQWSVVFALLIVLVTQLDTFSVYRALQNSEALRAQAAAAVDPLLKNGARIIDQGAVPASSIKEECLAKVGAMKEWEGTEKKDVTLAALKKAGADLEVLVNTLENKELGLNDELKAAVEKELRKTWLLQLGEKYAVAYHNAVSTLEGSELQIGIKSWDKWTEWWCLCTSSKFGLLASWLLVSLGAPFWFNTLKSLASLRPKLAEKLETEEEKKPAGAAPARK